MSMIRAEFDRYVLRYNTAEKDLVANIECYSRQMFAGRILFISVNTQDIPPNKASGNKYPFLFFYASQFNDIINILRYEKPLYLMLNTDTLNGYLSTSLEEIGEQEP